MLKGPIRAYLQQATRNRALNRLRQARTLLVQTASAGSSVDSFRLTDLLGDNQARIIQVIWRVRW